MNELAGGLRPSSRHAALHSSLTMPSHPGHSQKPLAAISAHESFEQPSATARQGDTKTGGGLRPSSEHAALHSSLTMPSHPGHWQKPLAAISAHESFEQPSATARQGDTKTGHASLHSSATMLAHPGHWQRPPSAISKHESVEHSSASGQMNATDFFLVSSAFATDFFLVSSAFATDFFLVSSPFSGAFVLVSPACAV